jgi:MFS transporter, PPP family, 3-phenylpropionic acid transporter
MVLPKAAYFFYYAATAALLPFIALYYAQAGLSAAQIGLLSGILPLVTLVSAPLWGAFADATRRHHALLLFAIAGTMAAVLALSRAASLQALVPIVIVNAFFMAPIIPLVDSTVLTMLGERRSLYGRQRLWGAIGWGITAPLAGSMMDRAGMTGAFGSYVFMMFGCFLVAIGLPVGRSHISASFRRGVRGLLGNWQWLVFLASFLVGGIVLSIEMSFLFLYMNSLGASKALMGLSLAVATVSELPVWFYSNRMLERFGTRKVLVISLLACAAQGFAFSLMVNPLWVLPIQLLHGLAFSASWAAGVAYSGKIAPPGMGATAQGVFSGVAFGLRSALGAFIGGLLYQSVGPAAAFRLGGVAALVGLVFFLLASRRREVQ